MRCGAAEEGGHAADYKHARGISISLCVLIMCIPLHLFGLQGGYGLRWDT
jgi:hypothetical protein